MPNFSRLAEPELSPRSTTIGTWTTALPTNWAELVRAVVQDMTRAAAVDLILRSPEGLRKEADGSRRGTIADAVKEMLAACATRDLEEVMAPAIERAGADRAASGTPSP